MSKRMTPATHSRRNQVWGAGEARTPHMARTDPQPQVSSPLENQAACCGGEQQGTGNADGARVARGAGGVTLAARQPAGLAGRRAGGVGRAGLRGGRGHRRQRRVLAEELHGQEHLVERVDGDGPGGVHAAGDLGPGPHGLHVDAAHVVGEVERVGRPGEGVHRVERAQVLELGQGVELGQRVVQQQRLQLVGGEVGEGGLLQRRERRVLGHEHGDAHLGVVGLPLEGLDHVALLQVVEERVERARHAQELREVHVVRRRRRCRGRRQRHGRRRRRAALLTQCRGEEDGQYSRGKNNCCLGLHHCSVCLAHLILSTTFSDASP
nr:unknown [Zea mays]